MAVPIYFDSFPACSAELFRDAKWPRLQLSLQWRGELPGFSEQRCAELFLRAARVWGEVAPLEFQLVRSGGDIAASPCRIDGPQRTLAWSELPSPSATLVRQCYDLAESWVDSEGASADQIDLLTVMIHELGHALGLDHSDNPEDVLYPSYRGPQRRLGPGDVQRIQELYGRRAPAPPPGGPPVNPSTICLILRILGGLFRCDSSDTGPSSTVGVQTHCRCRKELAAALRALASSLENV